MIHEAWGGCVGPEADMRATADVLAEQTANIASIYAERSGRTAAEYRDLMSAETWAVGQKAVDLGLADTVRKPASSDDAQASPRSETARQVPVGGRRRPWQVTILDADPTAGRNDTGVRTEESSRPGRGEGHVLNWDGPAAMSAAAKSDDPAAAYKAICAGRRDGDPSKQASWALPHHAHPGDAADPDGVRNALARLPQTQGLENEAAAKAHLEAHLASISPDSDNHAGSMPAWLTALTAKEAASQ